MKNAETDKRVAERRPELLVVCGAFGLFGSAAPVIAMMVASVTAEHDFVADTISDLGRGDHAWIMDTGFYINAAAMLSLAIAAAHYHLGRLTWSLGIFALALLALVVTLIGVWDEFGDTNPADAGMAVHTQLTFLLGPLYLAGPLLMMNGIGSVSKKMRWMFIVSAVAWIIMATAFKLATNSIDGLLEKIAVAATLLWTLPLSFLFWRVGRQG